MAGESWFEELERDLTSSSQPSLRLRNLLEFALSQDRRELLQSSITLVSGSDCVVEFSSLFGGSIVMQVSFSAAVDPSSFRILVGFL
jgi:hypothetical protein